VEQAVMSHLLAEALPCFIAWLYDYLSGKGVPAGSD
jgi:hypothetical protein